MPVTITRAFIGDSDRYLFDFKLCPYSQGYAQVDTKQDASYYGTWCNPTTRRIVNYAEGDVTVQQAETDEEFVAAIRELQQWNDGHGWGPLKIDGGMCEDLIGAFTRLGLADLLH